MDEWPQRSFGELTDNFDNIRKPVKETDRRPGPYPYFGASGVVDRVDGYLFDGEYLLIAEDGENLRTRNTPIAFLARSKFWVNNHAHIVRGNREADTRFLLYALLSTNIGGYLTGSTMPKLTQGNMDRIRLSAPPLPQQRSIAHVLSTLDEKIELNKKMNETLEGIAQAIFKSWFIDFDPVRAKMEGRKPFGMDVATAALFPDSFEDSEMGEIPKGWKVNEIKELAKNIQYGLTQSASQEPVGPRFLRITDIQGGHVDWGKVPFCIISDGDHEKYKLKAGDVLVARTGASTGENIYLPEAPDAVFASYLVRFQFDDSALARVVGAFMRTPEYFNYVAGCIGGSAQPNASAQVLAGASFVVPPPLIAKQFLNIVDPLDKKISANNKEIRTLAALRDALLPKLLSGKIRMKA